MLIHWKSPYFLEGARICAPTQFGMGMWGLVVGVAMVNAGLTLPQALGMTIFVFAGSAQLAALPLIVAHAPIWVIFVTALVVNLRFLIMSALIAQRFAHLHWAKRTALGFYTGDVTSALFMDRFPSFWKSEREASDQQEFLLGLIVPNWFAWQAGSILGIILGSQIPSHWGVGYAGTLAILCVMLPLVRNRAALVGVVVAGIVAVLAHTFPYRLGILLAVIIGMAAAMFFDERVTRKQGANFD